MLLNRYDARHLLSGEEIVRPITTDSGRLSPSGWSDLPSDTEDTFFFSASETDDFRRDKRRRLLDRNRVERFRAMARADEDAARASEGESWESWGGSDEEPSDEQRALMHRTATHIMSSPNPGQLEMRILTNHGEDKRFAFLRGRWKNAWSEEKRMVLGGREREAAKAKAAEGSRSATGLMGLAGYGESSDEGGCSEDGEEPDTSGGLPGHAEVDEEKKKEARRARAREWAANRRPQQA